MTEKLLHIMKSGPGVREPTGELAPEVVEMQVFDSGTTTGVPPRGLDIRQSFPDRAFKALRQDWTPYARAVGSVSPSFLLLAASRCVCLHSMMLASAAHSFRSNRARRDTPQTVT